MHHRTIKFQQASDKIINKIFLRFIPRTIRPNCVTIVRILLVPIVYLFMVNNRFDLALLTFVIAACTDFIDGAMARTRDQITDLGKMLDPIADKLLILVVLAYIAPEYLIVKIFIFVIILELSATVLEALFISIIGSPIGANIFGKIKMILQSLSVVLFILGFLGKNATIINISEYTLFIALVFAMLSLVGQILSRINRLVRKK